VTAVAIVLAIIGLLVVALTSLPWMRPVGVVLLVLGVATQAYAITKGGAGAARPPAGGPVVYVGSPSGPEASPNYSPLPLPSRFVPKPTKSPPSPPPPKPTHSPAPRPTPDPGPSGH
jgi:hypothetical protein